MATMAYSSMTRCHSPAGHLPNLVIGPCAQTDFHFNTYPPNPWAKNPGFTPTPDEPYRRLPNTNTMNTPSPATIVSSCVDHSISHVLKAHHNHKKCSSSLSCLPLKQRRHSIYSWLCHSFLSIWHLHVSANLSSHEVAMMHPSMLSLLTAMASSL